MASDLELASTPELIDELLSRFDHAVFCGLKDATEDKNYILRRHKGCALTVAGLADWAKEHAFDVLCEDARPTDDEGNSVDDGTDVELDDED